MAMHVERYLTLLILSPFIQRVVNETKEGVIVSNTAFLLADVVRKVGIDSISDHVIFCEDEYSSENELDSVLGESEEEILGPEYSSGESLSEDELSEDLRSCSDDSGDELSEGEYTSIDASVNELSGYSKDTTDTEDSSSVEEENDDDEEVASTVSHYLTEECQSQAEEQEAEKLGKLWEEGQYKYYGRYNNNIITFRHHSNLKTIFTYFAPVFVEGY